MFKYLGDFGVKKNYELWEIYLTRKINFSSLLGAFNVCSALLFFLLIGYYNSIFECVVVLLICPLVFYFNVKLGYIAAAYLFTFIGCFLFYFLSVKMGQESYAFLYYFPLVLGIIQMLGRKETFRHLLMMFIMCLVSIGLVVVSYRFKFFHVELPLQMIFTIKYVNIFFSFFTALGFILIISFEANKQEEQLKSAVQQKEVLLAELFHRVKNNLNIISSLLNLKKESVVSLETQTALEECRNLIFSMALVHNKIYNSNKIDNLNFRDYLHDLSKELINSFGGDNGIEFDIMAPEVNLNISQAIPCGLIINELVTNTFKHAKSPDKKLKIELTIKEDKEGLKITYTDNGPGMQTIVGWKSTLGLQLIKSLTEQLEGRYSFQNNNGLQFNLNFVNTYLNKTENQV